MRVDLQRVSFTYPAGVQALREVTLTIESGEFIGLIGANGAGKTTLVKQLNGLLRPTQGDVLHDGQVTRGLPVSMMAHRVAFAFQNPRDQLFERSVEREIAFGPTSLGWDGDRTEAAVQDWLQVIELTEARATHPYDLPQHERKLLTLAAAAVMGTPVVVLDEPTMGQDADGYRRVGEVLSRFQSEGRTLVAISHDLEFCAEHLKRLVLLEGGSVAADGTPSEILTQSDLLARAGLETPGLVRLARELGWGVAPVSATAFVEEYSAR